MDAVTSVVLRSLEELTDVLARAPDEEVVLGGLSSLLCDVLGMTGATACLASEGGLQFIAGRPSALVSLERIPQDEARPARSAFDEGRPVVARTWEELRGRWSSWAEQAREHGVLAVAAVPMRSAGATVGAVCLYSAKSRDWPAEELQVAQVMTNLVAVQLMTLGALGHERRLTEDLQRALDTRVVIEQAKGILANENAVSVDAAFEILRRHARGHNATVRSVAAAVVELGLRPPLPRPADGRADGRADGHSGRGRGPQRTES